MEILNLSMSITGFVITQLCLSGFENDQHDSLDKCRVPIRPGFIGFKELCLGFQQNSSRDAKCTWIFHF